MNMLSGRMDTGTQLSTTSMVDRTTDRVIFSVDIDTKKLNIVKFILRKKTSCYIYRLILFKVCPILNIILATLYHDLWHNNDGDGKTASLQIYNARVIFVESCSR